MGVKKGTVNNPNGRIPGSKNKKTEQWEKLGKAILEEYSDDVKKILDEYKGEDKDKFLSSYFQLLEYFKPKQARIYQTSEHEFKNPLNINIVGIDSNGQDK